MDMANKNLTIIDADSIIWIVGYKYREKRSPVIMKSNVDKFIRSILSNTKATAYLGYFGSNAEDKVINFRKVIYTDYKANRKEPPDWFHDVAPIIIEHMKSKWKFIPVDGMEADDAVSIAAETYRDIFNITIATGDKDLRNIPEVNFYEFKKNKSVYITQLEAETHLAQQVLCGDPTDNIPGLFSIGKIKAKNIVKDCTNSYSLFRVVAKAYAEHNKVLYAKGYRKYKVETEAKIKASDWYSKHVRTKDQLDRKLRIELDDKIQEFISSKMIGGWKEWLRTQYNLVNLLKKAPSGFNTTVPIIYTPITAEKSDFLYNNIA